MKSLDMRQWKYGIPCENWNKNLRAEFDRQSESFNGRESEVYRSYFGLATCAFVSANLALISTIGASLFWNCGRVSA